MTERTIPLRSQLDPQYTWATTDLYPTDQDWEAQIPQIQAMVESLKACQGTLGNSGRELLEFLKKRTSWSCWRSPLPVMPCIKRIRTPGTPKLRR